MEKDKKNPSVIGRVGVLMGGCSSERPISLKSGKAIFESLKEYGCNVAAIDVNSDIDEEIAALIKNAKIDVAFIALHGRLGEDGRIQAILDAMRIPYPGSGVEASRVALNKILSQEIFNKNNIPVPDYIALRKGEAMDLNGIAKALKKFPVVVKPASEGSSIGITMVENMDGLQPAIEKAFQYDAQVLIECFIEGRELTVGILDEKPLPAIEIRPKSKFFDFEAKYQAGMTEYIVPAQLSRDVGAKVQAMGLQAHRALGCRNFSRVDIMLDKQNNPFVLEVNTIPGFTATSLLPKAAKVAGLDFTQLCLKLINLAYAKQK